MRKVVLVTGMQAAGKSTIAPLLASRLGPPAATVDGDVYYNAVVSGAVGMTPDPEPEALRQLQLRYDASALVARWLDSFEGIADPHLVVLVPSVGAILRDELKASAW